ncbi:hypothetical protein M407DRAFT_18060 [Tulasnella calospora MUT 4182]|uniref:Uncharacterized protein n=1 Tax=Tulasnella calospora MUT 4182 TaxID=1051891 RepID=A0A0C3MHQ1_9AGAM|nr:hypothetical protein M407DRAFT_18060 [Tulasnella calospora MUT 4182]
MPLTKKRKAAQEREYDKRRLKGWTANFNPESNSDTEYTDDFNYATDEDSLSLIVTSPLELSGSEDDSEESDGSDLLEMEESVVDSDDWDPAFQTLSGLYPLFTTPVSFSRVKGPRWGVYTGNSRTTRWREQSRRQELTKQAQGCCNIRTYFKPKPVPSQTCSEADAVEELNTITENRGLYEPPVIAFSPGGSPSSESTETMTTIEANTYPIVLMKRLWIKMRFSSL